MKNLFFLFSLIGLFSILNSCKKVNNDDDNNDNNTPIIGVPLLTTIDISFIGSGSVTCGGNITYTGTQYLTARGFCWSTGQTPTINDNKIIDGKVITGSFIKNISGLSPNTIYYVRAYATNSEGTGYGDIKSFTTLNTITDFNGNIYNIVSIGTQTWMAENLKVTHYRDGTTIPNVTDNTTWDNLTTGAYCSYNNITINTYGLLYNWYTVNDSRNIAPAGWHVPSDAEWTTLINYLGGVSVAGSKLRETGTTHWLDSFAVATNESGFSALPGGYREEYGYCYDYGWCGYWWTSTAYLPANVYIWYIHDIYIHSLIPLMNSGYSIRCIKD